MSRLQPADVAETFEEQARGSYTLVGNVLVPFGFSVCCVAVALGLAPSVDLGFLTRVDIAVIGAMMCVVGATLRRSARRVV